LVGRFQDANIYQTWSFGAVRWGAKRFSHLVLRRGEEVVAIAQLRIVELTPLRVGIAYLRWGPLCRTHDTPLDADIFYNMAAALHEEYVRKRGLCLRILPNIFAGSAESELFQAAFRRVSNFEFSGVQGDRTLLLDLSAPIVELRKSLDQKWRNQLNRAEKNGLTIVQGDGPSEYNSFVELYREMWVRKRFETDVSVEDFARIQAALPPAHRMKTLICFQGNAAVAGIVVSAMGNTGIYLLGATSDHGLKAKGAYLLQWAIIKWLKENGFRYYDLGGIDPERNPGVYHFKSGLSGCKVTRLSAMECRGSLLSTASARAADFFLTGIRPRLNRLKAQGLRLAAAGKVQTGA
jgi:lipid II:glycine glycyltransferase (peptidoglycan interpeptide bridge formation enzyme)